MSGGAWSNDQPLNLTIPAGAGPNDARTVIGVFPVPAELVTYYLTQPALSGITKPETIVDLTISYDGHGNYTYQALVVDSSATPITSSVTGTFVAAGSSVAEASRLLLNPGAILGGGRTEFSLESATLILRTDPNNTPTQTVAGTRVPGATFHIWSLAANGTQGWGPTNGLSITDCYLARTDVARMEFGNRLDIHMYGGDLTATALSVFEDGDANPRWAVRAGGIVRGGDGTLSTDTTWYRSAAGVWASDKIVANIAGTGETWHNLTMLNSWTSATGGGGDAILQYRLMPDGTVHVIGVGTSPAGAGYTQVLAQLPSGYRPVSGYGQTFSANDGPHLATVAPGGNITLFMTATSTKFWLNIRFPIDAS